jgi:hypothetical protein
MKALSLLLFFNFAPVVVTASEGPLRRAHFGFNYIPQGFVGCEFLSNANWQKAMIRVAQDLDLMRSLGATVIRIPFWSPTSGFTDRQIADSACQHLPDYITLLKEKGFGVIIFLSNTYQGSRNGQSVWLTIYRQRNPGKSDDELFEDFKRDSLIWHNGIVDLVESSVANDAVIFYDYTGEYSAKEHRSESYFKHIYRNSHIPQEKAGQSVLIVPDDLHSFIRLLKKIRGSVRFLDFHVYPVEPHVSCPGNPDYDIVYDSIAAHVSKHLTGAKLVIGEFGRRAFRYPQPSNNSPYPLVCPKEAGLALVRTFDEPSQAGTIMDIIRWARKKDVPIYAHWMLWDHSPNIDVPDSDLRAQVFGIGYEPDEPKAVLGSIAELFGIVNNGDMEIENNGKPANWIPQVLGSRLSSIKFASLQGTAATNLRFAHLETVGNCASCAISIRSEAATVSPDRPLFVNAYIRSNLDNVRISVFQYDDEGDELAIIEGPQIIPTDTHWRSYVHQIPGGWSVKLAAKANTIVFAIGGTVTQESGYLDVDAVSASQ